MHKNVSTGNAIKHCHREKISERHFEYTNLVKHRLENKMDPSSSLIELLLNSTKIIYFCLESADNKNFKEDCDRKFKMLTN